MTLKTIEIETAPNPRATVLLMHGLGADGNDFVPIAGELDLSAVGPVRFVFPNAPIMPVTINGGYQMPAWYDILGSDLAKREDEAGLRTSMAAIEALLAREKARGIPAERIVIAGFSQGCAMALRCQATCPWQPPPPPSAAPPMPTHPSSWPTASKTTWWCQSAPPPRTTRCAPWATA
jgi:predicted esterase